MLSVPVEALVVIDGYIPLYTIVYVIPASTENLFVVLVGLVWLIMYLRTKRRDGSGDEIYAWR